MEEGSWHRANAGALLLHEDQARLFSLLHIPHSLLPATYTPPSWFGTWYSIGEYSYIPFEVCLGIFLSSVPPVFLSYRGAAVLENQAELRASS